MSYKDFFDYHVELLKKRDADALVEHDYHDDAVMILLHAAEEPRVIRGKASLKKALGAYLEFVFRSYVSTEKFAETEDSLFLEATVETINGKEQVYDALFMKDGKIFRHYSGIKGRNN